VPAARPGGLGATRGGSQPWWVARRVVAGLAARAALAGRAGVLAVGLGAAVVAALSAAHRAPLRRHDRRRARRRERARDRAALVVLAAR
jgi:hypothetical protein